MALGDAMVDIASFEIQAWSSGNLGNGRRIARSARPKPAVGKGRLVAGFGPVSGGLGSCLWKDRKRGGRSMAVAEYLIPRHVDAPSK